MTVNEVVFSVRGITASIDCATAIVNGRRFYFNATQAECHAVLLEAYRDGVQLKKTTVVDLALAKRRPLSEIFRVWTTDDKRKKHPAWGVYIVDGGADGTVTLTENF